MTLPLADERPVDAQARRRSPAGACASTGSRHPYRVHGAARCSPSTGIDLDIEAGAFVDDRRPQRVRQDRRCCSSSPASSQPTAGTVAVGGGPVTGPGRDRGVVFQHPTSLYPWLSVRENVELGLRLRGVCRVPHVASRALAELDRVGLAEFAERAAYELSGGMQQRCQIARVLANDPDVMLMDEPFGALDALTREQLQEQIRELWRSTRRTVVLITHSVEEAVLLGTRVLVMSPRPGRVAEDLRCRSPARTATSTTSDETLKHST